MLLVTSYLLYKGEEEDKYIYQLNTSNASPKMHTPTQAVFTVYMLTNLNLFNPLPLTLFFPLYFFLLYLPPSTFSLFHKVFFTLTRTQLHSDFRLYSNA